MKHGVPHLCTVQVAIDALSHCSEQWQRPMLHALTLPGMVFVFSRSSAHANSKARPGSSMSVRSEIRPSRHISLELRSFRSAGRASCISESSSAALALDEKAYFLDDSESITYDMSAMRPWTQRSRESRSRASSPVRSCVGSAVRRPPSLVQKLHNVLDLSSQLNSAVQKINRTPTHMLVVQVRLDRQSETTCALVLCRKTEKNVVLVCISSVKHCHETCYVQKRLAQNQEAAKDLPLETWILSPRELALLQALPAKSVRCKRAESPPGRTLEPEFELERHKEPPLRFIFPKKYRVGRQGALRCDFAVCNGYLYMLTCFCWTGNALSATWRRDSNCRVGAF